MFFSELFYALFESRGLKKETIEKMAGDFGVMAFLRLLGAADAQFSDQEKVELKSLVEAKKMDDVFRLMRAKYSDEEWDALIEKEMTPLLDSYLEEVAKSE